MLTTSLVLLLSFRRTLHHLKIMSRTSRSSSGWVVMNLSNYSTHLICFPKSYAFAHIKSWNLSPNISWHYYISFSIWSPLTSFIGHLLRLSVVYLLDLFYGFIRGSSSSATACFEEGGAALGKVFVMVASSFFSMFFFSNAALPKEPPGADYFFSSSGGSSFTGLVVAAPGLLSPHWDLSFSRIGFIVY